MNARAFLAVLCVAACGRAAPDAGCEPMADGVHLVRSAGPGAWLGSARLTELWRVGGTREGEDLAFPNSIVASPSGRLAVADFGLAEVILIEPDGRWTGPVGRRGRGPGEYAHPIAVAWSEDGRLTVFDVFGAKAITYAEQGASEYPIPPSFTGPVVQAGSLHWAGVQPNGGALLTHSPAWDDVARTTTVLHVLRVAPGASTPDTLVTSRAPGVDLGGPPTVAPGWPRAIAAAGAGNRIAVAGVDGSYRILVLDGAARPLLQVCRTDRPLPPLPASSPRQHAGDERDPMVEALARAPRPPSPAAVHGLFWGADGTLWVARDARERGHGNLMFARTGGRYDVFDADGTFLGRVQAPAGVQLVAAAAGRVWGIHVGELDETWIIAWSIETH